MPVFMPEATGSTLSASTDPERKAKPISPSSSIVRRLLVLWFPEERVLVSTGSLASAVQGKEFKASSDVYSVKESAWGGEMDANLPAGIFNFFMSCRNDDNDDDDDWL
ncbi:hypothetical protein NQZ68_019729 [Dissostichus eleginoides]|nr:hypothetical protein NQZ68_019729 [Dissostichus eleginoides]